MTVKSFKKRIKEAAINTLLSVILALLMVFLVTFCWYSFENPIFFLVSLMHLIVTGFGSVWLCILLGISVDFPGVNVSIFLLAPSIALFHGFTYTTLALNMLEVTHVTLDWKTWILFAASSLVVTVVVGGGCAWYEDRRV